MRRKSVLGTAAAVSAPAAAAASSVSMAATDCGAAGAAASTAGSAAGAAACSAALAASSAAFLASRSSLSFCARARASSCRCLVRSLMRHTEHRPPALSGAMGLPQFLHRVLVHLCRLTGPRVVSWRSFMPSSPLLEQAATHTPHSLHFHGVTTMRVWPSGRSSCFRAPARQAFSHLPQAKHLSVKLGR